MKIQKCEHTIEQFYDGYCHMIVKTINPFSDIPCVCGNTEIKEVTQ